MAKPSVIWSQAIKECADGKRARHFLEVLRATSASPRLATASAEQARVIAALLAGSQALGNLLVSRPDWLAVLEPESLRFPRRKQGLENEVRAWFAPLLEARDWPAALARLGEFRHREMLRIAARDLARLGATTDIILEISNVADVCLDAIWQICFRRLSERHGQPYHQDAAGRWHPTAGCVIGLGKLGGQELNYSSDVDVIFVYEEEGSVFREPPAKGKAGQAALTNHAFFNRLAEALVAEISRVDAQGVLYRIDLRLRPEGDSGPLSRSLGSYEIYYSQWGQTWERMMLIKGRGVAGDLALAAEFLETIQPFRYPRSVNRSALGEIAAMKERIENEVVRAGELERNVKLGRGGIREIEFVAQTLQLLHGGQQPFLQGPQTVPCLQKLVQYELLSAADSRRLSEAYHFLRDLEHRLQMENNLQTHSLPAERPALERLARLMGFGTLAAFEAAHQAHRAEVRRIFETLLRPEIPQAQADHPLPPDFQGAEEAWKQILAQHSFKDPAKAVRLLREFVEGPGYVHVSRRTSDLALQLLPRMLALCPHAPQFKVPKAGRAGSPAFFSHEAAPAAPSCPAAQTGEHRPGAEPSIIPLSDPDRVLMRLDSFIHAYGARATLFELWNSNPSIFELMLLLFDRSEFLAELAIRTPALVDELVTSDRLRQRKTAPETLRDLRHGLQDKDQALWLRQYHQAELMRIGLRDILGLADFEQYLTELSALADACLQYALEVVMRKHKLKRPPFAIVGLGKLGGAEIDYGSDLDIIFVTGPKAKNLTAAARYAIEVLDLLSKRTEQGIVFHTDVRLRPDGEKGLLATTLTAHEEYYRQRAGLWEIQTLTRTRPIAGDLRIGEQFQKLAAALSNFQRPSRPLAAAAPDWKEKIRQMRGRIEKERTPKGKDELAIKSGAGGLMDAEFIAQTLCMEHGWQEANTLHALEKAQEAGALPEAEMLIQNYRHLRRVEGILRRWSYEGESVLPDDPAAFHRVAVRCGFESPEVFRATLARWRKNIREVWNLVQRQ